MGFDPVPWFVEGGAQHSAETARLLAFIMLGGQEGVLSATDLAVKQLSVAGAGVRISPGACGVINRATGQNQQTYIGRVISDDIINISPTGVGVPRRDMIVAQVENPWLAGEPWADPVVPAVGPYIFGRVIQGVPVGAQTLLDAGLTNRSAIPLARIDIPANTATITSAMITDLRQVANPLTGVGVSGTGGGAEKLWTKAQPTPAASVLPSLGSYITWPTEADWQVRIPAWATSADVYAVLNPVMSNNSWGNIRANLGGEMSSGSHFDDNFSVSAGGGGQRTMIHIGATIPIPAAKRGTVVSFKLEAQQVTPPPGLTVGTLTANDGSGLYVSINFKQNPVLV